MGFFCGCHLASPHFTTRCHCGSAPGLSGSKEWQHLREPQPGQQAACRLRGSRKEGTKAWKGVFTHLCQLRQDMLFDRYLLWTFSQAEAGGRLTRSPLLSLVDGWECRRPLPSPRAPLSVPLGLQLITPEVSQLDGSIQR